MRVVSRVLIVGALGMTMACSSARERDVNAAIGSAIDAHASPDVRAFYAKESNRPIWVDDRPTRAVQDAFAALKRAHDHGLNPERYDVNGLAARAEKLDATKSSSPSTDLIQFELDVTSALIALGRDVALGEAGRNAPESARAKIDFGGKLAEVVDKGRIETWPDPVRPVHPQYAALQKVLAENKALDRASDVAATMNGWRLLPDDLGARHIIVNIPQYHLFVQEAGKTVLDSKVVVGKRGDETPVFSSDMASVIFSPYWNIPESIAEGETIPAIIKNPEYLSKNNLEVLRRSGGKAERIDPASVDWNDPSETEGLSLRQRPGPSNALGHVKFMLPNRFSVYLHDTPADKLFERDGRAFSHGCVRLEDPVALAKYVLGDDPAWTDAAIRSAMASGVEKEVKLKQPIPVHIVYFTVWVDEAGTPQFFEDVYGRLVSRLARRR